LYINYWFYISIKSLERKSNGFVVFVEQIEQLIELVRRNKSCTILATYSKT